jgi:PPOX class probable F420-dependent enzyme
MQALNHPAVGRPHDDRRAIDADHDGRAVDRFKRSWPPPAASSTILIDFAADMDAAKALVFTRKNPHAVLATMKRDGTPQLSPVLVGVDSKDRLVVSTRESAMKTLNVRRDPRAWLCVLNDSFFGDWVQLSGDVEVVSLPTAMEPLVEYYRSISGEHPDWDDYRAAMIKQRRCLIRVTPRNAGPTVFG